MSGGWACSWVATYGTRHALIPAAEAITPMGSYHFLARRGLRVNGSPAHHSGVFRFYSSPFSVSFSPSPSPDRRLFLRSDDLGGPSLRAHR